MGRLSEISLGRGGLSGLFLLGGLRLRFLCHAPTLGHFPYENNLSVKMSQCLFQTLFDIF